jgi:hypothetical protein
MARHYIYDQGFSEARPRPLGIESLRDLGSQRLLNELGIGAGGGRAGPDRWIVVGDHDWSQRGGQFQHGCASDGRRHGGVDQNIGLRHPLKSRIVLCNADK